MVMTHIGIIGGSGVYTLLEDTKVVDVDTPFGRVTEVRTGTIGGVDVVFLPRHGSGHSIPPHRINFRANIFALHKLGVERIMSTTAVGSCHKQMPPGTLAVLDQFLDFTKNRITTFYEGDDGHVFHVDMTTPYCPEMGKLLYEEAKNVTQREVFPEVTYACMEGPRYETPAEINAIRVLGADVVGMTNVPEVILAREKTMCYSSLALVTNWAAGMADHPLGTTEVVELMNKNIEILKSVFSRVIDRLPAERGGGCDCSKALDDAEI